MTRKTIVQIGMVSAFLLLGTACDSDETGPEDHTPAAAKLFDQSGAELTPNITLTAGATPRVEVRFYDAHGDLLEGLEEHHYTSLTFAPTTLATGDTVPGMRFFWDLTVGSAGSGTLHIGYGHSPAADELSFGPFSVTVQ
jgi:hypothetical protein